jgi:hypothetical protein
MITFSKHVKDIRYFLHLKTIHRRFGIYTVNKYRLIYTRRTLVGKIGKVGDCERINENYAHTLELLNVFVYFVKFNY